MRSSLGYSMLLHSRQKRNVICSWGVFWLVLLLEVLEGGERAVGEDMVGRKGGKFGRLGSLVDGLEFFWWC